MQDGEKYWFVCVCGRFVNLEAAKQGKQLCCRGGYSVPAVALLTDRDCVFTDSNILTFELIINQTVVTRVFDWIVNKKCCILLIFFFPNRTAESLIMTYEVLDLLDTTSALDIEGIDQTWLLKYHITVIYEVKVFYTTPIQRGAPKVVWEDLVARHS